MKLKEKFKQWLDTNPNVIFRDTQCEKIAEDYAIEFARWLDKLTPRQRVSVWSKNGESKGLFNMDNEQLLEIFKKEKGL